MSYKNISSDEETDDEYITVTTFNEVLSSKLEDVKKDIAKDMNKACQELRDDVKSQIKRIIKDEIAEIKTQIVKEMKQYVSGSTFTMLSTKNFAKDRGSFKVGKPPSSSLATVESQDSESSDEMLPTAGPVTNQAGQSC